MSKTSTVDDHAAYLRRCKLAVDAAAAAAAAKSAWKKLQQLERKASELWAEAMHAYAGSDQAELTPGLKKASRKHWRAQYVAAAGFQDIYENRGPGYFSGLATPEEQTR